MTEKEKIRAEIERLYNQSLVHKNRQVELGLKSAACTSYGKSEVCKELLSFIDSMQEEPVSEELEEAALQHLQKHYDTSVIWDEDEKCVVRDFKAGANWKEQQFEKNRLKHCNSITNEQAELEQGFIDQHLNKYNRMPTFLDAIEYGMRLQKEQQLTAEVVDG